MVNQKVGNLLITFLVIASFLLIMTPHSLSHTVQQIGVDQHPLGFLIAPALYSYGTNLIPNVDYFTQYGTGLGFVFSHFLNADPITTYKNAVIFTVAGTIFFALTYFLTATYLLNSKLWAYFLTITLLMMNFFGPAPLRGTSCWPIRYPLLGLFCLTYISFCHSRSDQFRKFLIAALALLAGASIFWNTEIGIYMIAIGSFCIWFNYQMSIRGLLAALAFSSLSLLTFIILCLAAFGGKVLTIDFVIALIKPAILYGSGFGFWPANWLSPYEFIFNTLIPIFLAATVIWGISNNTASSISPPKRQVLLLISLLSLAQLIKYWNMSLAAVWFSNSYLPMLVFIFWLKEGIEIAANSYKNSHSSPKKIRVGLSVIVLAIAYFYATSFRDSRMDFDYGYRMYRYYPSFGMKLVGHHVKYLPPALSFDTLDISKKDIDLITRLTSPGEQVFIYSSRDWAYLLGAKRAPGFPFTPSTEVPLREQGEQWSPFLNAEIVFYDTASPLWSGNGEMHEFVRNRLKSHYQQLSVGDHLIAYKRSNKTVIGAGKNN